MKKYDVIIVGAGAIGLSTAYFLRKSGCSVAIIDKDSPKDGCSFGNAGMIVPSHFNALAAPGVIWQGVKWSFAPTSPFSISPHITPHTAKWLWQFKKKANSTNVAMHQYLLLNLHLKSRELFGEVAADINGSMYNQGLLMLFNSRKGEKEELEGVHQAERLGLETEVLDKTGLQELEPNIDFNVMGGVHYKSDRHINPNDFMQKLFGWVSGHCDFIQSEATGFKLHKNKIVGVNTSQGLIEGQSVFISAGLWSNVLLKKLNVVLPLLGGKGYSFNTEMQHMLQTPTILTEAKVAITPLGNQIRFAGTMQIGASPNQMSKNKVKGMMSSIELYMPQYKGIVNHKGPVWSGMRPLSPDGIPYIGRVGSYQNLFVGTGHAMMGVSLAPVTGWILTQLLHEKTVDFDMRLLNPERYAPVKPRTKYQMSPIFS